MCYDIYYEKQTDSLVQLFFGLRGMVCSRLKHMGIILDEERNLACREGVISSDGSPVKVSVIPANEELGVARATVSYLKESHAR